MNIKKDETNKKYCVKRNKFRKFVYLKSSYIFDKTLVLSVISSKCCNNNNRIFEEKESIEILKIKESRLKKQMKQETTSLTKKNKMI